MRYNAIMGMAVAGLAALFFASGATAQGSANAPQRLENLHAPSNTRVESSGDSSADSSANGDPFVRYVTPGQCEQAAIRLRNLYWTDKRRDLLVYAPEADSVPAPVLRAIRQCASRFSVDAVSPRYLLDLAQLYTWGQQDDLAARAVDRLRRVLAPQPAAARGWVWQLLSTSLLNIAPTRMAAARASLAELDSLGTPAATPRLFAHAQFLSYAVSVNDLAAAQAEGRAAITASRQMSPYDRIDWMSSILNVYESAAFPLALTHGGSAALALFDTAMTEVLPLRPAGSIDQQDVRDNILRQRVPFATLGKRNLPPVHATAWYGTNGDTVYPRPGHVTLLAFTNASCNGGCYPMFAVLRRLHEKYGARLDLVLMTSTAGYFRDAPMPSPVVEADSVGSYYTKFQHLPVALAVETTAFTRLPDGRRQNERTTNFRAYDFGRQGMLVDGDGTIRWLGTVEPQDERVLDAMIQSITTLKY